MNIRKNCIVCENQFVTEKFPDTQELVNWKFDGVQYIYVECTTCKLLHADPIPTPDTLKKFYNTSYNYKSFAQGAFWKKIQSYTRLFELKKYLPKQGKVLDFGCGHGYFVKRAGKNGFKGFGFDIGSESIISSENSSIIYSYDFDTFKETGFDMITAWHVVEHLAEPLKDLAKLYDKLNTGGVLAIAVPNNNSLGIEYCGEKWSWVQEPMAHIYHYNGETLSKLLTKAGFRVKEVITRDTLSSNLFDVMISKIFFSNKPRGSVGFSQSNSKSDFVFHAINVLRAFFIVFSIFTPRNKGAELLIIAKK